MQQQSGAHCSNCLQIDTGDKIFDIVSLNLVPGCPDPGRDPHGLQVVLKSWSALAFNFEEATVNLVFPPELKSGLIPQDLHDAVHQAVVGRQAASGLRACVPHRYHGRASRGFRCRGWRRCTCTADGGSGKQLLLDVKNGRV